MALPIHNEGKALPSSPASSPPAPRDPATAVFLRLPRQAETGTWAMALLATGAALAMAPSWAGALLALGMLAAVPARLGVKQWHLQRTTRTSTAGLAILAWALLSGLLVLCGGWHQPLAWLPLLAAGPLCSWHLWAECRARSDHHRPHALITILGTISLLLAATAVAVPGHGLLTTALPPALALACFAITAVPTVRAVLARALLPARPALLAIDLHAAVVVIGIALWTVGLAGPWVPAALLLNAASAVSMLSRPTPPPVKRLGWLQACCGVMVAVAGVM